MPLSSADAVPRRQQAASQGVGGNIARAADRIEHVFYRWVMPAPLPTFVWIDVTGSWADPHPGILLWWRQRDCGGDRQSVWEGWVITAWAGGGPAHGEKIYVHQSWIDAAHIRVAEAPKPRPNLSRHKPANHGRSGFPSS